MYSQKLFTTKQDQLTFSEKMVESDMEKFKATGDVKFYKSAKHTSENDNAPYVFASIKKTLMNNPTLAIKMNLLDGAYWECLKLIAREPFSAETTLTTIEHIHKRTDKEDFNMLIELANEKLFKYIFITDSTNESDLNKTKERNSFIQIVLSYFDLQNKKTPKEIKEWETSLEKSMESDYELAYAYHRYWSLIRDFNENN